MRAPTHAVADGKDAALQETASLLAFGCIRLLQEWSAAARRGATAESPSLVAWVEGGDAGASSSAPDGRNRPVASAPTKALCVQPLDAVSTRNRMAAMVTASGGSSSSSSATTQRERRGRATTPISEAR